MPLADEPPRDLPDRVIRQSLRHPAHLRTLLQQAVPQLAAGFDCERARLIDREFPRLCAERSVWTTGRIALEPNALEGLIGPNGAGKTTVFNLITGVYEPTAGSIALGGQSIAGRAPSQIARRGIARTFQNIRLFANLSVVENVRIACQLRSPSTRARNSSTSRSQKRRWPSSGGSPGPARLYAAGSSTI